VVFTLLVFEELHGGAEASNLAQVTTWTILLSVVAHGLSSGPLAAVYARRLAAAGAGLPELRETPETLTRRRSLHDKGRRPSSVGHEQGR